MAGPLLLLGAQAAAVAGTPSAWVGSGPSAARLIAGGTAADGTELLAGLQIRLDPGTITYWRSPGDGGVAPTLDTGGSSNIASVTVDFPAPGKIDEAGLQAFGYRDGVTLPLHIRRTDPGRPAMLRLDLDYAVCATQCLPAKAHLEIDPGQAEPDTVALIEAALAKVPTKVDLGAAGPLAIDSVVPAGDAAKPSFAAKARASASADLFVEAPDGWFIVAGKAQPDPGGGVTFSLDAVQHPEHRGPGTVPLTLTLVDHTQAIEVGVAVAPVASQ